MEPEQSFDHARAGCATPSARRPRAVRWARFWLCIAIAIGAWGGLGGCGDDGSGARCGDGVLDELGGEACDDGNNLTGAGRRLRCGVFARVQEWSARPRRGLRRGREHGHVRRGLHDPGVHGVFNEIVELYEHLGDIARAALEALMQQHNYTYRSDFARKYVAEGYRDLLRDQLQQRFGALPTDV